MKPTNLCLEYERSSGLRKTHGKLTRIILQLPIGSAGRCSHYTCRRHRRTNVAGTVRPRERLNHGYLWESHAHNLCLLISDFSDPVCSDGGGTEKTANENPKLSREMINKKRNKTSNYHILPLIFGSFVRTFRNEHRVPSNKSSDAFVGLAPRSLNTACRRATHPLQWYIYIIRRWEMTQKNK